jgi:hypothetical protein
MKWVVEDDLDWIYRWLNDRLAWRMKAFPSNVSVTIINRRQYDSKLSPELNQVPIGFRLWTYWCTDVFLRHGSTPKNIFVNNCSVIKLSIDWSIRPIDTSCFPRRISWSRRSKILFRHGVKSKDWHDWYWWPSNWSCQQTRREEEEEPVFHHFSWINLVIDHRYSFYSDIAKTIDQHVRSSARHPHVLFFEQSWLKLCLFSLLAGAHNKCQPFDFNSHRKLNVNLDVDHG